MVKQFGYTFRPTYKDKRSGENKRQSVWWIQWSEHGKVMRDKAQIWMEMEYEVMKRKRLSKKLRRLKREHQRLGITVRPIKLGPRLTKARLEKIVQLQNIILGLPPERDGVTVHAIQGGGFETNRRRH